MLGLGGIIVGKIRNSREFAPACCVADGVGLDV